MDPGFAHFACRLALLSVLLVAGRGAVAALPATVSAALREANIPESHVAMVVQDLDDARPTLLHNAQLPFNPASVMKLVTTLAALDRLGPEHTWLTRVRMVGEVTDGVLDGDLVLQGGGDPALNLERFWLLLREVRQRGIREIRGDVVIDDALYGIELVDPGEFDAAPLKPYNAAPTALLANYNVLRLRLGADRGRLAARLDPPALAIANGAILDLQSPCNSWQDGLSVVRDGDLLRLGGRYPASCGERSLWLNLMCPPATVAAVFSALWLELGGTHLGQVRMGSAPPEARPLLDHESVPLSQIVRDINKHSNNVMAKMLFLNFGAARFGAPATWEKGARAVREWLREQALDLPELVLENGSGLSRNERIAAGSVAALLAWAAVQPAYYEFAASLPALGLEGTQRNRLDGTPLAGRAWLKTGSLDGARSLAGYVMDSCGRRRILVLFINHPRAAGAARVQEAAVRWAMGEVLAP